ncbi:MAG: hypothetical protein JRC92_01190 [Deltaproteobacteria bacterium]|nr:hypothetical protein [Deltaproteobacteria bacterium]
MTETATRPPGAGLMITQPSGVVHEPGIRASRQEKISALTSRPGRPSLPRVWKAILARPHESRQGLGRSSDTPQEDKAAELP